MAKAKTKVNAEGQKMIDMISFWKYHPDGIVDFARKAMLFEPTAQQEDYFREVSLMVNAKRKVNAEIISSATNYKGPITDQEKEYARKKGIVIHAGRGVGKDASTAGVVIPWFLLWKKVKIPCTGPSGKQMKVVLWSEIRKWISGSVISDWYEVNNDFVRFIPRRDLNQAFWKTSDANDNVDGTGDTAMSGLHEEHIMFIVDEATGVSDKTLQTWLDSMISDPCALMILICNPNRTGGFAIDAYYNDPNDWWVKKRWSLYDCPERVKPEQLREYELEYGRESNEFRISVLGLPPKDDVNSLIQREWVENAIDKDITIPKDAPVYMGIDPSGQGKDKTIAIIRHGNVVIGKYGQDKSDSIQIAEWAMWLQGKYDVDAIFIDNIGIGAGSYDQLKKMFPKTYAVNVNNSPRNDKYNRLRDEVWCRMAKCFEDGVISIKLPGKHNLMAQLTSPQYKLDNARGKIQIESKKDLRRRGVASPDEADALMLTFKMDMQYHAVLKRDTPTDPYLQEFYKQGTASLDDQGWMSI